MRHKRRAISSLLFVACAPNFRLPHSEFHIPTSFSHKPVGPDIVNVFVTVKGYLHIDALQVSGNLTQSL